MHHFRVSSNFAEDTRPRREGRGRQIAGSGRRPDRIFKAIIENSQAGRFHNRKSKIVARLRRLERRRIRNRLDRGRIT